MASNIEQNQIMNLFGKGKNTVYTYGFLISEIHYTSKGYLTSSPNLPNGFDVRCKVYIKGVDIQSDFEMLFIFKYGIIIFTTETCIYCCENIGSFVKYIDPNLKIIKQSWKDSKVGLILEMTKSLRGHKFSGKTRIFSKNSMFKMIDENKQAYNFKHNNITVIFTKVESVHVHLE
jgi:hypothetical protein